MSQHNPRSHKLGLKETLGQGKRGGILDYGRGGNRKRQKPPGKAVIGHRKTSPKRKTHARTTCGAHLARWD